MIERNGGLMDDLINRKNEPLKTDQNAPFDEFISRKKAIDAHYEYCNKHPDAGFPVWSLKILEDLPSAQPDSKETSSTHKALDTISRQAAMEEISKQQTYKMFEGEDTLYLDANDVGSVLASLPSAQPEPCKDVVKREDVQSIAEKSDWFESSDSFNDFMWALYELPSAQPETHEERTETHACDCISRKEAIDAFLTELTKRERKNLLHTWSTVEVKYFITKMLEQMQSAQHELPEWAQKVEEYRQSAPPHIHNPLAWALYQTWKEYDR